MDDLRSVVIRAQAGDVDAFDEIVHRFQAMACGYAFSILGDFHLAEDAAQEAFIEAYCSLPKLREPVAFASWLRRIVFKRCDRITRGKDYANVPLDEAIETPADEPGPDVVAEQDHLRSEILAAVRGLPEVERTVTALHYINGYSTAEVGSFLDVPAGTVKSRLYSARKKLKERLWTMVEETIKKEAPDEDFARRVSEAVEVYCAKGPERNHILSDWDLSGRRKTGEILAMGKDGLPVVEALGQSERPRARVAAALLLGLHHDPERSGDLVRLLSDPSSRVRMVALRWYAVLVHPRGKEEGLSYWVFHSPADSVPEGVEHIVRMADDPNEKVRIAAVKALSSYAGLRDLRVDEAINKALGDGKHKVRHEAARALGIECPGCGKKAEAQPR